MVINQFSDRMKRLRNLKNLRQHEVADAMKLVPSKISAFERGEEFPDAHMLKKLSVFFNVSMDYLWGETLPITNVQKKMIHLETLASGKSPYKLVLDGQELTKLEVEEMLDYIRFQRNKGLRIVTK